MEFLNGAGCDEGAFDPEIGDRSMHSGYHYFPLFSVDGSPGRAVFECFITQHAGLDELQVFRV